MEEIQMEFKPIGIIHSSYKAGDKVPNQVRFSSEPAEIEIYPEYEEGLTDIEGFSHILVTWVFHKSKGYKLITETPQDVVTHGVFSTRSPNRPNPIAISVAELVSRKGRILSIKGIDAIDGSPVLDIKPYITNVDDVAGARLGWFGARKKLNEGK
jgi:tRNA-Thr(GGU) m(6)t(6)A37 methyltransferase TsaA